MSSFKCIVYLNGVFRLCLQETYKKDNETVQYTHSTHWCILNWTDVAIRYVSQVLLPKNCCGAHGSFQTAIKFSFWLCPCFTIISHFIFLKWNSSEGLSLCTERFKSAGNGFNASGEVAWSDTHAPLKCSQVQSFSTFRVLTSVLTLKMLVSLEICCICATLRKLWMTPRLCCSMKFTY